MSGMREGVVSPRISVSRRAIVILTANTETRLIWNWPAFSFTRGIWRYTPEIDPRRSFSRTRIGPVKVEITRWC